MVWLWLILVVGIIMFLASLLSGYDTGEAVENGIAGSMGCLYVIVQIFIAALLIYAVIWTAGWLFGSLFN